jgi:hypothetical protein
MARRIVIGIVLAAVLLPFIGWAALDTASRIAATKAATQTEWIRTHIVPGASRADAYAMLKSQGLVAYNWAYVKGKAIPADSPDPKNPLVGAGCETIDWSSGAWPYQNEPLPKQEGVCVEGRPARPIRNPDADIELGGGFNIFCGWSTSIKVTFGDDDRVRHVHIGQPYPTCM